MSTAAWAAGFIDGEGHISIVKRNPYGFAVRVTVAQQVRLPLDKLQELFGGTVKFQASQGRHGMWIWLLQGTRELQHALSTLMPHLVLKQEEAAIALRMVERLASSSNPRSNGHTAKELALRMELHDEIRLVRNRRKEGVSNLVD